MHIDLHYGHKNISAFVALANLRYINALNNNNNNNKTLAVVGAAVVVAVVVVRVQL